MFARLVLRAARDDCCIGRTDLQVEAVAPPGDLAVRQHQADFSAPYFTDIAEALGCALIDDWEQE
jgi:hypothetical protein